MRDEITVETDLFEHREAKPHFINPCCFGEDFVSWLRDKLAPLTANGFLFAEPIQEDYGWGFWTTHQMGRFWTALSYVGDGPQEEPAQWVVSVNSSVGLKRLFYKSHQQTTRPDLASSKVEHRDQDSLSCLLLPMSLLARRRRGAMSAVRSL